MSYLARIAALHAWRPSAFRPFRVAGRRVGRVRRDFAAVLADFPRVFRVTGESVDLADDLADADVRSRALGEVVETLAARGDIREPRGETYGVAERWAAPALLRMDRGVAPLFGIRAYGVHVNGFRRDDDGLKLWVATRAASKHVAPGKLDHMVAGGLSHGHSAMQTLVKEAAEEADVPEALARRARPVGAISYVCELEGGLRDDTLFLYDLEVAPGFIPRNTDGELSGFALWPAEAAMARVRDSDDFKFNVAVVMIDFFLRHGCLDPDREPDYPAIAAGIHRPPAQSD